MKNKLCKQAFMLFKKVLKEVALQKLFLPLKDNKVKDNQRTSKRTP